MRFLIVLFAFALGSCTDKGSAPGGVDINIPQITKPVNGATFASIGPMAATGAKLNSEACAHCGSGTNYANVFSLASIFALQGKIADNNSCMIKAVAKFDAIPGVTDGTYKYVDSGEMKMKVKVLMTGDVVSDFEIFTCYQGAFVQYMGGTNVGGSATFLFRSKDPSGSTFVKMDATGTMSGDTWTSKSLTMGFNMSTQYLFATVTQQSDYLDIEGVIDTGTLGTLDGADVRLVSRAQLIGSTLQTYALGDGSIRAASGVGAPANTNWNGDTGVHGAGPTTYDSVIAAATLPSVPTTRASDFESDEVWDCAIAGPSTNLFAVGASNPALMADVMACEEIFE